MDDPHNGREGDDLVLVLATSPLKAGSKMSNLSTDDIDTLPQRIRTTCESSRRTRPWSASSCPLACSYDGTFTTGDAQTFAVMLLDAICSAFE